MHTIKDIANLNAALDARVSDLSKLMNDPALAIVRYELGLNLADAKAVMTEAAEVLERHKGRDDSFTNSETQAMRVALLDQISQVDEILEESDGAQ